MRGEYGLRAVFGSAPRVRGTLTYQPRIPQPPRISPACAGNTLYGAASPPSRGDQPRTCGEYSVGHGHVDQRISPACAGNTWMPIPTSADVRGQPRTCGEYTTGGGVRAMYWGSAPHMRGIPAECGDREGYGGISPACAGNAPGAWPSTRPNAGQPRTCGEYLDTTQLSERRRGSAPHMRGIPGSARDGVGQLGVSPAHAGNTLPELAAFRRWGGT